MSVETIAYENPIIDEFEQEMVDPHHDQVDDTEVVDAEVSLAGDLEDSEDLDSAEQANTTESEHKTKKTKAAKNRQDNLTPNEALELFGITSFYYDPAKKWLEQAECKDSAPEVFLPVSENKRTVTAAKAVCFRCVVRKECIVDTFVMGEHQSFSGIRGGMSSKERRALIKKVVAKKKAEKEATAAVATPQSMRQ